MASENLEDTKTEDEAPLQEETKLEDAQPSEERNASEDEKPEKQELHTVSQEVTDNKEVTTATGDPEGVNGDTKSEESKQEQEGDREIPEVAENQESGADEEPEDKNVDKKGEDSVEEEYEGDKDAESEDEGKSEDEGEGSEEANKGREGSPNTENPKSKKSRRDSAEKKGKTDSSTKEPVTPSIERPARERKTVERYSVPSPGRFGRSSASKGLSIEKGRGTTLKDIPNVAFKLSKRKADDNLQLLHTILFGKKAKAQTLKRNISQFSGYVWLENEQEKQRSRVKEKLEKCVKEKLMDFCDVLNIPINKASVKKEELSGKLLEFLESPHATTDILLADKEQKGKKRRRVTPGKIVGSGEPTEVPAKKQKSQPGRKRKHASEVEEEEDHKVETSNEKDASHDDSDDDDVATRQEEIDEENRSDEDDKSPEKMPSPNRLSKKAGKDELGSKSAEKASSTKKVSIKSPKDATKSTKKTSSTSQKSDTTKSSGSPSKSKGRSKKLKVEENRPVKEKPSGRKQKSKLSAKGSAEEQGKGKSSKKVKREPSREEMHAVVVNILKQVDFNTATLSDILRQLGTHFGVDLMHRKAEVKDIITDVINNMSDEEEEAEDEGGASDDSDKDEDKEDDA